MAPRGGNIQLRSSRKLRGRRRRMVCKRRFTPSSAKVALALSFVLSAAEGDTNKNTAPPAIQNGREVLPVERQQDGIRNLSSTRAPRAAKNTKRIRAVRRCLRSAVGLGGAKKVERR